MISRHTHKQLTWIDLHAPTPSEVRDLIAEFDIHPLVGEELLVPSLKPKVERYENVLYLILHFPTAGAAGADIDKHEIDFIIGKNFLITTHYETVDPLLKFSKMFEVDSVLDRANLGSHAGFLFFYMAKKLYRGLESELEHFERELSRAESGIFSGEEKAMVNELSRISRHLLNFKQSLVPHREVLESLEQGGRKLFGDDFAYHLRSIFSDYYRVSVLLDGQRDALSELRETNNSLLSTKQNEVMKTLTIMAFITLPLTVITQIFSMNATSLPIVGTEGDFWVILGIMATVALLLFAFFRRKGWF